MLALEKAGGTFLRRALPSCAVCLLAFGFLTRAAPAAEAASEYQVKAVFLLNFTRFVEWPAQTFATPTEPFVIGILGDDPFGGRLDEVVRNERIGDHPLVVRRFSTPEELGGCQMVFIDRSDADASTPLAVGAHRRGVLIVSEADGAAEHGAMIQFATENSHIRLRINADAAHGAGLVISSKLLHLAEIVSTRPGE
jgi:hypothetical protein